MYGLAAMGGREAAAVLLQQVDSDAKWRRKAAVFALGEGAPLTAPVVDALCRRLAQEDSVYVRAVAAAALGCIYRRSTAAQDHGCRESREGNNEVKEVLQCRVIDALLDALATEDNRLDQGLRYKIGGAFGVKMWRPCDENDICEGSGLMPPSSLLEEKGLGDRFEPVRSAVREALARSLVVVATHPLPNPGVVLARLVEGLSEVIGEDRNVLAAGLAMDALHRLGARYALAKEACGRLLDGSRSVLPADALSRTPSE